MMKDEQLVIQGRGAAQFKNGVNMIAISLLLTTWSTLSMNNFAVEVFSAVDFRASY